MSQKRATYSDRRTRCRRHITLHVNIRREVKLLYPIFVQTSTTIMVAILFFFFQV